MADNYRTSDLYYAAYLKVAGVEFVDTVREDSRVFFLFDEQAPGSLRDLKRQFFSGQAKVSALDYAQAIKTMKTLTHM